MKKKYDNETYKAEMLKSENKKKKLKISTQYQPNRSKKEIQRNNRRVKKISRPDPIRTHVKEFWKFLTPHPVPTQPEQIEKISEKNLKTK